MKLTDFLRPMRGGLRLIPDKEASLSLPIQKMPPPKQLRLPLYANEPHQLKVLVAAGESVRCRQVLAELQFADDVSVPVYAPFAGQIVDIVDRPLAHRSGLSAPCVLIDVHQNIDSDKTAFNTDIDPQNVSPEAVLERICAAGIVGMGGAAFPAIAKLRNGEVDTLLINGAECEPAISCDEALMREFADEIISGALILGGLLGVDRCLIGIEGGKSEALNAMQSACEVAESGDIELVVIAIPTQYPSGDSRQLAHILTGRKVAKTQRLYEQGLCCFNVATARAVKRAVIDNEALLSRVVTIAGSAISTPQNIDVPFGMSIAEVLAFAGHDISLGEDPDSPGGHRPDKGSDKKTWIRIGGPVTGFTLEDLSASVDPGTNCILVDEISDTSDMAAAMPCIRCGQCADVCPVNLAPQQLYWHGRAGELDRLEDYSLDACIECAACDLVCPSEIPLLGYFRYAKSQLRSRDQSAAMAEVYKQRYEFTTERRIRDKQERAAQRAAKAEAIKATAENQARNTPGGDSKKDAIKAAMERAKARKAALAAQKQESSDAS